MCVSAHVCGGTRVSVISLPDSRASVLYMSSPLQWAWGFETNPGKLSLRHLAQLLQTGPTGPEA